MTIRFTIGAFCLSGLLLVFVFQHADFASVVGGAKTKTTVFLINNIVRFLLNDALAIGFIYAAFEGRKYVIFSLWVQLAGMLLFLIPYLTLKLYYPLYNGPLLSFLHRLILNPTLMLLLIPSFYSQKRRQNDESKASVR